MRIALGLEYDGSAFCGWQSQAPACGVQDHLERALAQLAAAPIAVTAAGRTDAGVHAAAQVVHFDTDAARSDTAWVRGTNTNLHAGARVVWARETSAEFHARYSALSRTYRYILVNDPVEPALLRGRVGWYHRPLDLEPMAQALRLLEGEHDFSAFRDAECQAKTPVRRLLQARVDRVRATFLFSFRANAFLHHMVRNIVGAAVYVGSGRQPPQWLGELLAGRDRRAGAPTFAPDGLYLAAVEYDRAFGLPDFRPAAHLDLTLP
jgi:tRNA pseudouridine38-40 synthase